MKKIFFIVLGVFFLTISCNTGKKAMTPKKFESVMEKKGYVIKDVTSQYGKTLVVQVLIAIKDGYQIEFFEAQSKEVAVGSYDINKEKFERSKGSGSVQFEKSLGDSSRYTVKTNSRFKVVSRIKNTFIYADVPAEKEKEVSEILKTLKY